MFQETIYTGFESLKQYFSPVEPRWYESSWFTIIAVITAIWEYRFVFMRDLTILCLVCMVFYMFNVILKQHRGDTLINKSTLAAPTTFNNTMNISVWLSEINEFLESNKIINDSAKQKTVIDKLDKTNKILVKEIIESKQIKTYKELEEWLRNYFNKYQTSKQDFILQFISRKQQRDESLSEYYNDLQQLAQLAYPNASKETMEAFVNEQFVKGLHNTTIQQQIVLTDSVKDKTSVLHKAVELQSKLQCLAESTALESVDLSHIQFRDTNRQQRNQSFNTAPSRVTFSDSQHRYNNDKQYTDSGNNRFNNYHRVNSEFPNQRRIYNNQDNQAEYQRNNTSQTEQKRFINQNNQQGYNHQSLLNHQNNNARYPHPQVNQSTNQPSQPNRSAQNTSVCYRCQQQGHISRNCPQRSISQTSSLNEINPNVSGSHQAMTTQA